MDIRTVISSSGLRATQPRLLVGSALLALGAGSPQQVHGWISRKREHVDLVTVYRVLEAFTEHGLAHPHSCSGAYSLCQHIGVRGGHTLLHCEDCGGTDEIVSPELAETESHVAKRAGFHAHTHARELHGTCKECS